MADFGEAIAQPADTGGQAVGYKAPGTSEATRRVLEAYKKYGSEFAGQDTKIAQEQAPALNKLEAEQYSQYAPLYAALGLGMENTANPGLAGAREATFKGYSSLLGGMDPNRLSGAELSNAERGINRMNVGTGNLNTGDATTTVANAGVFGDALSKKRAEFGNALSLFPGLNTARSTAGVEGANKYQSQTPVVTAGTTATKNAATGFQQQQSDLLAGRKTKSEVYKDTAANACGSCYIFKEVFGFQGIPTYIIWCRDFFYRRNPKIEYGYKKMSYWLIPLMQRCVILRYAVVGAMIYPLAQYGKYLTGYSKWTKVYKPIAKFWLYVWSKGAK